MTQHRVRGAANGSPAGRRQAGPVSGSTIENKKRTKKNHKTRAEFVDKYADVPAAVIRAAGFGVGADNLPMLTCVVCEIPKERTTDNFSAHDVTYNGGTLETWFAKPFPWMNNSASHGCDDCWAAKSLIRDRDIVGDGNALSILHKYPCLSLDWMNEQKMLPCAATGSTLPYIEGPGPFGFGVNSRIIQIDEQYTTKADHDVADCEGVFRFANVRQSVPGPNSTKVIVIKSLSGAFNDLYTMMITNYLRGQVETDRLGDIHAGRMRASDFQICTKNAKKDDSKKNLDNDVSKEMLLELVRDQHARCATSGVFMTSLSTSGGVRGPFDVHMDRIDDASSAVPKGHIKANVAQNVKGRLFNSMYNITRKDFLLVFLNQISVELPPTVRELALADYHSIEPSARDAWPHEGFTMPAPPAFIADDLGAGPVADVRQSTTPVIAAVEAATKKRKKPASSGKKKPKRAKTFFCVADDAFDAWSEQAMAELYASWPA
jgi:hypothetical protein